MSRWRWKGGRSFGTSMLAKADSLLPAFPPLTLQNFILYLAVH
uniref:Uncharacterized protein n=1 Tax=Anguilla anguilla TaxID=7936 RepID=A0A0E9WAS5_ANGAN